MSRLGVESLQKGAALLVVAAACAGSAACSAEQTDQPPVVTMEPTPYAPDSSQTELPQAHELVQPITIYPVTVDAPGFRSVATAQSVAKAVGGGWQQLSRASGGVVTPNINLTIMPVRKVKLPDVTAPPDMCDDAALSAIRDTVKDEVAPFDAQVPEGEHPEIPVIVIESAEALKSGCVIADAGPGAGIMVYHGTLSENDAAHEIGHVLGLGHGVKLTCSNTWPDQSVSLVVSEACKQDEYGNHETVMGNGGDTADPDPLDGFGLDRLGALSHNQIVTVEEGSSEVVHLDALADPSSRVKLIRIPTGSVLMGYEGDDKKERFITSMYIELSSYRVNGFLRPVGIKIYGANDQDSGLQETYLFNIPPDTTNYHITKAQMSKSLTFVVGQKKITLMLDDLRQGGPGAGTATVSVKVDGL